MEKANSIIDISRIPSINTIERIEIPIIQRDYAQGRKERNIRIKRDLFLDEIFSVIFDSGNKDLKLYYIYGKVDGTTFIPIDGQQRLTTLYLLAYYLSSRENCFKNFLNLPELTYRTRFSAKNFTAELRKNPLDYTNDSAQKPSEKIKQSGWFFSEYESDPTVMAILTMLDSIHNKYEAIKESKKSCLLGCLFGNLKRIKFEVFSLDGNISTDDLYIKMNARGRALSNFDNFNSMIDEIESPKENTKVEKFSGKSKDWENTFFEFYDGKNDKSGRDNIGSRALSELIRIILTTEYIKVFLPNNKENEDKEYKAKKEILRSLLNADNAENKYDEIPPSEYRKWLSLDKNLGIIDYLKKSLDVLSKNKEKILEGGLPQFGELKNSKYKQKIILFAKISFKVKLEENNISDENDRLFKDWLRVISNLIENTAVDNPDSFKKFIVSTDKLLSKLNNHNLDILECLCAIYDRGEDLKDLDGFNECQLKEEIVKAKLISRSDEWKVAIIDAEKPKNIDSKIAFILRLSNTIGYVNCDFKLKVNCENTLEEFNSYTTLIKALFEIIYSDIEKADQDKKFLWQRYLLSCNIRYPYGIRTSENINLLLPSSDQRSFSWKRFFDFSRDKTYNDWKNLVKVYKRIKDLKKEVDEGKVLECLLKSGIKERLEVILKNPNELTDYDLFIIYPEAMEYCKEGYFRDEIDINKNIYIIRGTRCVGTTSPSIRSYCGYIDVKIKEKKDIPIIIKDHCAYSSYENENEKSEYKWEELDKEYLADKIKELDS